MKIKRGIFSTLSAIIFSAAAFGASFSGSAGIKGNYLSDAGSENFSPILKLNGYFSGQLNLSSNMFLRSELSVKTADVLETKLVEDTESVFCIDELSFTYVRPFLGITQYLSFFTGTFDSIGTDVFLQRQFGISPVSSIFTENYLGTKRSAPYELNGFGGSYIIHVNNSPYATGIYLYKNTFEQKDINQLNIDLRAACACKWITADLSAGFGAPMDSKNGTEDVILLVDELYLHTGLDLLIGNKYSHSLYIQAGFDNIALKASGKSEINSDEIYLLIEPRLYMPKFTASFTIFSIPQNNVEKIDLLEANHTFGADLAIYTDRLYVKNKNFTFGFHTIMSFPERDFFDIKRLKELKDDDYIVKIVPFVGIPFMAGDVKIQLQTQVNDFKTSKWQDQFKLSLGYKAIL